MYGQIDKTRTKAVTIRAETYQKLLEYRKAKELPPSIVDVVSVAVEHWLDEQEKKIVEFLPRDKST
jgi:hypothetical protein